MPTVRRSQASRVERRHDLHGPRLGDHVERAARARAGGRPGAEGRQGRLVERGLPHGLELPGRPGQHDDQRRPRAPGRRRGRSRPAAAPARGPAGRPASPDPARQAGSAAAGRDAGLDHGQRLAVQRHGAARGGRDRLHREVVVGGPQAAGRADQVEALGEHVPEGLRQRAEVVPHDLDPLDGHARRVERARQHACVPLLDPSPKHLVARDEDGRARRAGRGVSRRPRPPRGRSGSSPWPWRRARPASR